MYGINADGWLAAHHVAHRELIERAERAARPLPEAQRRTTAATAPVVVAPAPVCC
jgi:hypothetical protein